MAGDQSPDVILNPMISIIVAVAENGVIGDKNALLWHISEDLKHFKAVTTGHPVVMGRKTLRVARAAAAQPHQCRHHAPAISRFPAARVVHSLEEAVRLFPEDEEVFVIGGCADLRRGPADGLDRFYLTRVRHSYEGDTRVSGVGREPTGGRCRPNRSPVGRITPAPFVFELYERR